MDRNPYSTAGPGERLGNLIQTARNNLAFVLFGGVVGYIMGHILLPANHSLWSYITHSLHVDYTPGLQSLVRYLMLSVSALGGAYVGLSFSRITNGPQEIDDPEAELEAALEADRQDWSEFRD